MKKKEIKNTPQINILQTMKNQIDFLQIFNFHQIQFLFENYDIIVFNRGNVLAKQKQVIDYLGIILNGGAIAQISKTKYKKNSFIGNTIILGPQNQKHPQTITAQSDGIIFTIRVQTLISLPKNQVQSSIKTKIFNFITQESLYELKGQTNFKTYLQAQFQIIDDKISQKLYQTNKHLSTLMQGITQPKQKQKFLEGFPLFGAKQKTIICSKHSKPYLLIVVKGQIIIKHGLGLKKQSTILEANNVYNTQGFIFDHNQFSNLYCNSNQVIFLMIDKQSLFNNYKIMTQASILKFCLDYQIKTNQYEFSNIKLITQGQNPKTSKQIWSPFRKSFKIQQLPAKKDRQKTNTSTNVPSKKKDSINTLQTLYQSYINNAGKNRTKTRQSLLTQYKQGTQRVGTMRTEYSEQNNQTTTNQRVKNLEMEIIQLKQQNKKLNQNIKILKLDLLQSQCRLKMHEVFKQIKNQNISRELKSESDNNKLAQNKSVTLKQAFELHLKNKKLELLVAKCAFKWLQITRRNRTKRENNRLSNSSLLKQSGNTR